MLMLKYLKVRRKLFKVTCLATVGLIQTGLLQGQPAALSEIPPLVPGKPVEQTFQGGNVHKYRVTLSAGQSLRVVVEQRGVDVVVVARRPNGTKISEVDSPNGTQGPEPITFVAGASGDYQIEVRSLETEATAGRYAIRIDELLSAQQYQMRLAAERFRDERIVTRLRSRAIPLENLSAGSGFGDLAPLKEVLRDVQVVGLGEATHGTREFFQIRHRLLEFLVMEMGFTVLAVEGSYSALMNVNDYVLHGKGERGRVLAEQEFWILDTEEVAGMIDWMRSYNQTVPDERKVKFFGIDPQANEIAMREVVSYLGKVAPNSVVSANALFQRIRPEDRKAINFELTSVPAAQLSELYRLISYLVLNKTTFVRQTSSDEFERALQNVRLVTQFAEFNSSSTVEGARTRDQYMAENFQYIVNAQKPGTRYIVMAHNAHISKRDTGNFPPMGYYLRRVFGNGYYAFGFSFNQGSFQAQVAGEGKPHVREFTLGPAPEKTVDWYLARVGIPRYVVDIRRLPADETLSDWLNSRQRMHWVGAIFSDKWDASRWTQPFVLGRDFDGLIFIETTSRARPTVTGRRESVPE
jgi:erythromycin esterase